MPVFACGTFYVLTVKNYFSGLMVNCKLEMIQRMQYIEVCSCDCFKISDFLSVAGRWRAVNYLLDYH